jgi:hypothetical protein
MPVVAFSAPSHVNGRKGRHAGLKGYAGIRKSPMGMSATKYDLLMSTNQVEYDLFMDYHIKMFFLTPTLIFRKLNEPWERYAIVRCLTDWSSKYLGKMIDNL